MSYSGYCLIPDMEGLPGLPELEPDDAPVRFEMLIRQDHPIFDRIDPAFLKPRRGTRTRKRGRRTDEEAGRAGIYEELPPCYAKIFGGVRDGKEGFRFRTERLSLHLRSTLNCRRRPTEYGKKRRAIPGMLIELTSDQTGFVFKR